MSDVKRCKFGWGPVGSPTVEYVLASDYDALRAELAQCKEMRDGYRRAGNEIAAELRAEVERLKEELQRANGTASLAIQHRDKAEREVERLSGFARYVIVNAGQIPPRFVELARAALAGGQAGEQDWWCQQYPRCECFAGCREKALEAMHSPQPDAGK